jgi:Flp pilus assembly protein TadD
MIRVVASAAVVGVLVAGGWLYSAGEMSGAARTTAATEGWPICTAVTALGTESDWTQLDLDFAAGKKALAAEDWSGAIAALKLAALRDPRNADMQNYIGYAHRRLGDMGPAMGHYQQALIFNPRHRSAREHLGELYLSLGEPIKAEEQLAVLKEICLVPCDEVSNLDRAIIAYQVMVRGSKAARLF